MEGLRVGVKLGELMDVHQQRELKGRRGGPGEQGPVEVKIHDPSLAVLAIPTGGPTKGAVACEQILKGNAEDLETRKSLIEFRNGQAVPLDADYTKMVMGRDGTSIGNCKKTFIDQHTDIQTEPTGQGQEEWVYIVWISICVSSQLG